MDLATLRSVPRDITIAGQTFKVSALTFGEWAGVQDWIRRNATSPAEAAEAFNVDGMSPYAARLFASVAVKEQQNWPPRIASAAWHEALSRTGKDGKDGNVVFLHAVLAKHQPGLTYEACAALYERASSAEVFPLALIALGVDPDAPKAPAAPGTTPGSTTPTSRATRTTSARRTGSSRPKRRSTSGS